MSKRCKLRTPRRVGATAKRLALPSPLSPLLSPLLLLLLTGCSSDIDTLYGRREGFGASKSVNGTAVLGDLFQQAGHRVFSWPALSPRLQNRADCIVWFPDDFDPPGKEVRQWLDNWLAEAPGRTLIYVGRDFDAAPWYWQHILADAPPEQQELIRKRLEQAKSRVFINRNERRDSDGKLKKPERGEKPEDCEWFTLDRAPPQRRAITLQGDPEWLQGVDAAATDIELRGRFILPKKAEVLLRSGDDALVSREPCGESQRIVVANGSFLLNLSLVNHEHRKLAGHLIEAVGQPPQTVVFLESGPGGPPILDDDPKADLPTGPDIFNIWPTNWILMHLAAVGIVFCFSRFPIFGRPKAVDAVAGSDFGRHVDALADLLERSGDRAAAMERTLSYRQK